MESNADVFRHIGTFLPNRKNTQGDLETDGEHADTR